MPDSEAPTSGRADGRKHNSPPEHGKIRKGEIRNRWGAKGKPLQRSSIDEELLRQAEVHVSRDENGPVTAQRRLIQEEFLAALGRNGEAGDPRVRDRIITRLAEATARVEQEWKELADHVRGRKAELSKQIFYAKLAKKPPPDVLPHPDHVIIKDGRIYIVGPIDHAGREAWETIKSAIRVTACMLAVLRVEYRRSHCPDVLMEMREHEKWRRKLMRSVPKGWRWKEEVYCHGSELDVAKDICRRIEEMGYVAPDCD